MEKIANKEIPNEPGIYIFKDNYAEPLYVGKAKNLRKRVPSYFAKQTSWKIKRLISEANEVSFVVAKNEADALLAEYSFIQEYKPKYNVQFKDDKSYPYVTLTNEEWPRAYISRKINSKNNNFGPFPFVGSAKRSLDHLINIFPVRTCTNTVFNRHQKLNKPCLLFDIEKCSGPCIGAIEKVEYTKLTKKLKDFYTGKSDKYINEKKIDMKNYSQKQEYEKANQAKNLINHLENARTTQTLLVDNKKSVDVLGVDIDNLDVVISCLLIRNGRIIGEVKKTLEPIDTSDYNEYLPQVILSVFSENEPSMEEVLFRRLKRLNKNNENDKSFKKTPDLILVDGGKGQLSSVKGIIDHFELDIDLVAIAKKEEELFLPNRKEPYLLNKDSEALFLLQNIRDEAHRFALQENRRLRAKELST